MHYAYGKVSNDVDIMVLFAHCVDDNTLAIIHVNLVLRLVATLLAHAHRNVQFTTSCMINLWG